MSKEELFVMHVYMCVCLFIDIILLIYYLRCSSSFRTSLYLFLCKYWSRKITDLSLCLVSFSDSSHPFLWPQGGLQCSAPASTVYGLGAGGLDSFSRLQLLVHLRLAVQHHRSYFIPCICSSPPLQRWQWGEALGHAGDAVQAPACCTSTALPRGKPPSLPSEPGPEISASCWQCQSSEVARHSRLFWLKIGQDLIEMKIHFGCVEIWTSTEPLVFSPYLMLIIWKTCKISGFLESMVTQ